jgi:hypothetical protein
MGKWPTIENCVIYIATAVSVTCLWLLGAGGHSFWMLLLLLFLNYPKSGG